MTRQTFTRFLVAPATAAALLFGGIAGAQAASEPSTPSQGVSGAAGIPVVMTTLAPKLTANTDLCQFALEAVATGSPVPVTATSCLREFMLEADARDTATDLASARPAPEACEALLPSLAIGEPVRMGAIVPCVEDYVTFSGQMAAR